MTSITDADVPLPNARVEYIVGLLEVLDEVDARIDIVRLGQRLRLLIDDLLPILEGAKLLQFVDIRDGDVSLTQVGREMARADILGRKEIFRKHALRVPLLRQVVGLLTQQPERRMRRERLLRWMETAVSDLWATRTIDIIIDWGRYAEILGYTARTDELFLVDNDDGKVG